MTVTGQTSVSVFDIEPGVALLGAGGAGTSVVHGAETLYYNPASLSELPGISFSSFYASYMGLANYSALALTFRNWGIGALLFDGGTITGYDGDGSQTKHLLTGTPPFCSDSASIRATFRSSRRCRSISPSVGGSSICR